MNKKFKFGNINIPKTWLVLGGLVLVSVVIMIVVIMGKNKGNNPDLQENNPDIQPNQISGLTGWFKNKISDDGKRWLDESGISNDIIVEPTTPSKFILRDGQIVTTDFVPSTDPEKPHDRTTMSNIKASTFISTNYTIFMVARYGASVSSNEMFAIAMNADKNGNLSISGDVYFHYVGFYAGLQKCSVITEKYDPINEIGAGCLEDLDKQYSTDNNFIQVTGGYKLHRVNSIEKKWESRSNDDANISPITNAQVNSIYSRIYLSAPCEYKELIIYNKELLNSEIDAVEKYLNKKYSVY